MFGRFSLYIYCYIRLIALTTKSILSRVVFTRNDKFHSTTYFFIFSYHQSRRHFLPGSYYVLPSALRNIQLKICIKPSTALALPSKSLLKKQKRGPGFIRSVPPARFWYKVISWWLCAALVTVKNIV